ncbi:MAG: Na/Pi cotransporter family protein [Candidatus Micrarchaeota archaeon]
MFTWELWFAIVPGLILFLYGIDHFSKEIQRVAGERFRSVLGKLTKHPLGGTTLGAIVTAIIQSSTATTVIAVGLVDAGTISFAQSLGIMFGANIGTTVTAQLVAFKLTIFAPFFILLGFVISLFGGRYKFLGKPIFYFGLVFFSLALISEAIIPFKDNPEFLSMFSHLSNVFVAIFVGIIATLILQSSSVTTGIVVLLAGTGLLTLGQGIPVILGANIGTTATSLLAASRMDLHARRASIAHFLFNVGGVLIFLPFITIFTSFVEGIGGNLAQQVANAHLIFNLSAATIFLLMLNHFKLLIEKLVPGTEDEIIFKTNYLENGPPINNRQAFDFIEKELVHSIDVTLKLFDESIGFLKNNKGRSFQRVTKLEAFNDFLDEKIEQAILKLSGKKLSEKEARKTVLLVRMSNMVEQLGDRADDLAYLSVELNERGGSLSPESMVELDQLYEQFCKNILILRESIPKISLANIKKMRKNDIAFRLLLNVSYQKHLERLYLQKAYAGTFFVETLSTLEQANAHVREIRKLSELYRKS